MNKAFRTIWNESSGTYAVADEHASAGGKSSCGGSAMGRLVVIGFIACGFFCVMPDALAATYSNNNCSAASGTGPDGQNHPKDVAPKDGSGTWSNVVGCDASGGNYLGVQVMGAFATAAGDGATSVGFASSAAQRAVAYGLQAVAAGQSATAIGQWTRANGTGSIAIGGNNSSNSAASGANAGGANALAMVGQSSAAGDQSIAIGLSSNAAHNADIAIGSNTVANGGANNQSAVAIGRGSSAVGQDAYAYGNTSKANADWAGALGNFANAGGRNALAVGNSSNAANPFTTAVGNFAKASADYATVVGNYATAAGTASVAMGNNSIAHAQNDIAIGNAAATGATNWSGPLTDNWRSSSTQRTANVSAGTTAVGPGAAASNSGSALGTGAQANGNASLAAGGAAVASGRVGVALGGGALASGDSAVAVGNTASSEGDQTVAVGAGAEALNNQAVAVGRAAFANANNAMAIGTGATVNGQSAIGVGDSSSASGAGDIGIGRNAAASGGNSIAQGVSAVSKGADAIALGHGAASYGSSDIAIGLNAATNANSSGNNIAMGNGVTTGAKGQNVAMGSSGTTANAGSASGGAVAIGRGQKATGDGAVALGDPNTANGTGAVALGANNTAAGSSDGSSAANGAVAIGNSNQAIGQGSVALGNTSKAEQAGALALGDTADAKAQNAIALGSNATASSAGSVALGANSVANGSTLGNAAYNPGSGTLAGTSPAGEVSVGSNGKERRITNLAAGSGDTDAVNVSQLKSLGVNVNNLGDTTAAAIGGVSYDPATGKLTSPTYNIGGQQQNNVSDAINALNQGWNVTTSGNASGTSVTAVQPGSTVTFDGGKNIALTQNGSTISIATSQTPTFTSVGIENGGPTLSGSGLDMTGQKITNLAPGDVSANSTDAVNGSQLNDTNQKIQQASDQAVKYDTNPDGSINYNSVTLNPGGSPSKLSNVAAGDVSANSTDAVNGSQLNQTNQTVNNLGDSTASVIGGGASYDPATGKLTGPTYNIAGGQQTTISDAINALNQGWNVTTSGNASGTSVTAVQPGSTVTFDGGKNIALTQNGSTISIATSQTPTFTSVGIENGGPTLSGSGLDMMGQKITNLAPGDVSANSTDAVNGSQLNDTNQKIQQASDQAVKYDTNPDGSINYNSVTLNPGGSPSKLSNVAAGDVSANSTDAVNGSQLNQTNQNVTKLGDTLNNIAGDTSQSYTDQNGVGIRYVRTNESGLAQTDSYAQSPGSTAVGYSATASADNALALGRDTKSSIAGGVALGSGAVSDRSLAPANGGITAGSGLIPYNTTDRTLLGAVSVGSSDSYRQITNVADGTDDHDAVTVRQLTGAMKSLTVTGTRYFHANSSADDSLAAGAESVAIGPKTVVNGDNGVGLGNGAIVEQNAPGGVAVGQGAHAQLADAIAMGTQAQAGGEQGVAIGAGTNVSVAGGVALGASSVANTAAGVAGYVPPGADGTAIAATQSTLAAVSVGDAAHGKFRQITGVAAGTQDSDAVNVSQLKAVAENVSNVNDRAVKYDGNPGDPKTQITLEGPASTDGGKTGGTKITNLAQGDVSANSTDAVNGAQLYETNQNVTKLGDTLNNIAGDTSQSYTDQNGMGIRYVRTNESGLAQTDSYAQAPGSTAVGYSATAKAENALALGRDAMASYVGSVALGANSVADGSTLSMAAYNPGTFALAGVNPVGEVSIGSSGAERRLTNVAAGAADTDAVNVSQLKSVQQNVDQLDGRVTTIENGGGIKYFHANGGTAPDSQANGLGSVAAGPGAIANGGNSVAMGNGATASTDGDVALGSGSVANRGAESYTGKYSDAQNNTAGTVSVGASGAERTISNVADGQQATDAVNLRQLDGAVKTANSYTDSKVQEVAGTVVQVGNDMKNLDNRVTNVENGATGPFQVSQDIPIKAPQASGANSTAGGSGAIASGAGSTALGNGAQASGKNSVALGTGSIADRDNAVSVGAPGQERQVTNVAPGTAGTDAVNLNQLNAVSQTVAGQQSQINSLGSQLQRTDAMARQGIAAVGAMASIPQLDRDALFGMGLGTSTFQGQKAMAVSMQARITENLKASLNGGFSGSQRVVGAGMLYQWK
ncbi:YadA-like family protein [Burkholderia ambifaria]|uniref:YadA-like family protein n=1 Tax=Burkholderia ambifaria TaxID=152480 RepID=UPI00158A56EF|nr:YadA-like family protein [Burkholderia ambifaria]